MGGSESKALPSEYEGWRRNRIHTSQLQTGLGSNGGGGIQDDSQVSHLGEVFFPKLESSVGVERGRVSEAGTRVCGGRGRV